MFKRAACFVFFGLLLVQATGCIELTGQRLAWRHDAQADTLTAVLFYDGIHESEPESQNAIAKSQQDLAEFVESGNIMLIDWWGEINIADVRDITPEELENEPQFRSLVPLMNFIETKPIGHYTESGRIGAAQYIHVRQISKVLAAINGMINAATLAHEVRTDGRRLEQVRTDRLRQKLAAAGHVWIKLDGQSIVVRIPFDPDDWARQKAEVLGGLCRKLLKNPYPLEGMKDLEDWQIARMATQFLSATPMAIDGRSEIVTFSIGPTDRPHVLRATIRDEYNARHVDAVSKAVPDALHEKIVKELVDGKLSDRIKAVVEFGPPEVTMLALAEAAKAGNEQAVQMLRQRARTWNAAGRYPQIRNVESELPINLINAVGDWYRLIKCYPLDEKDLVPQRLPVPPAPK